MNERKQIIYAWNYREWGGVQIYFLSLIKEVRNTFEVVAVLPENSEQRVINSLQDLGVQIIYSPPVNTYSRPKNLIERIRRRTSIVSSESKFVDVVLDQIRDRNTIIQTDLGFWHSALSLVRLSRMAHVFFTIHTALERHSLIRELMWKFKGFAVSLGPTIHFLASNDSARRSLKGYIRKRAFDNVVVTYAGFDPTEIETVIIKYPGREALFKKYDLPDRALIVSVGQFIERKGCWVVTAALKTLLERGHDFTFVWLSTTSPDAEQLAAVERFGLGDRFRIFSSDDIGGARSELLSLVLSADVFVLASLQEGLPIALVEAMALGRACLTTNVNAIPEAIEDGVTGVMIGPNDPDRLAKELRDLIHDPQRRKMLGSKAKSVAADKFNEKITAELTIKLYEKVWAEAA